MREVLRRGRSRDRPYRERRAASGLTVEQTAQALGIAAGDFKAHEEALVPMPLEMIFSLTNLLNIDPEEVLSLIYDIHSGQGHD